MEFRAQGVDSHVLVFADSVFHSQRVQVRTVQYG